MNEVQFTYDGWGNLESFDQDHDSTVATATDYIYSVGYTYETAGADTENGRNTLRRTMMSLPNGADVVYVYDTGHGAYHDKWASRVTHVQVDPDGVGSGSSAVSVASYSYNGVGHVVRTDYPEPDVMNLSYAIGSPNAYGNLDVFNRVVTSAWTKDLGTDHDFFNVGITYDRASNITVVEDTILGSWDTKYTIDDLNRLVQAKRGTYGGGSISSPKFDQQWTLDQVGNWDVVKLDRNGDTDFVDTSNYNDDRTHNDVNELKARDTDDNGSDNYTLTYFKNGAMNNDGQHYKYVWDAFGRLRQVKNRSNNALVAEYTYNGLGFRISEHYDTDTDGDVDGSDSTYHFVFDERWRIVATYRDDDADPKELFVHHAAGAGGYGTSSYIDAVILRDADLSTDWDVEADALDARHYYCQNWRADVSVIIDDSATIIERVMYSPYGVPFGIPAGDLVTSSSFAQPADGIVDGADNAVMLTSYSGSWNYCDLDNDGNVDSDDLAVLSANWGDNLGWGMLSNHHNRFGYAGYVFDEALAGTKWHVRHRVLESVLGRWIMRDPLRYIEGNSLYLYVKSAPVARSDSEGLQSVAAGWSLFCKPCPPAHLLNDPDVQRALQEVQTECGCTPKFHCSRFTPQGTAAALPGIPCPNILLPCPVNVSASTIVHELRHAWQFCKYRVTNPLTGCEELICRELDAYAYAGQCTAGVKDPNGDYECCVAACASVDAWAGGICNLLGDCMCKCNKFVDKDWCKNGNFKGPIWWWL